MRSQTRQLNVLISEAMHTVKKSCCASSKLLCRVCMAVELPGRSEVANISLRQHEPFSAPHSILC